MPRPVRPWFRFYVEAFADRKIRRLTPAQRWLWVAILGAARESPRPGLLLVTDDIAMTEQELADYAGVPVRDVRTALPLMEKLGMVDQSGDCIMVPNFSARQFESDNVTARTRKHRERSEEQDKDVPKNVPGNTPERRRAFASETEAETETDKEQGGKPPEARKRAHQLSEDFAPNEVNRRIAAERGVDIRAAFEQFADHHRAKGSTFKDWNLAFNTWLRRERPSVAAGPGRTPFPVDGTKAEQDEWARRQPLPVDAVANGGGFR
jgi:hypothetical protein